MAIVRTYECPDCTERTGQTFRFDKLHFDRNEPAPECPGCRALAAVQVPAGFSIKGNASRAGDITQKIVEQDYGLTNMADRQREGDLAVITPPHLRPAVDNFYKASGPIIAMAKAGAAAAKAEGSNPLTLIQRVAKKRGSARVLCNPVARG